jgi:hypothetical protein
LEELALSVTNLIGFLNTVRFQEPPPRQIEKMSVEKPGHQMLTTTMIQAQQSRRRNFKYKAAIAQIGLENNTLGTSRRRPEQLR